MSAFGPPKADIASARLNVRWARSGHPSPHLQMSAFDPNQTFRFGRIVSTSTNSPAVPPRSLPPCCGKSALRGNDLDAIVVVLMERKAIIMRWLQLEFVDADRIA